MNPITETASPAFLTHLDRHMLGRLFAQSNKLGTVISVSGVQMRMQDGMVLVGAVGEEHVCDPNDLREMASVILGVADVVEEKAAAKAAAITATQMREGRLVAGLGEALLGGFRV